MATSELIPRRHDRSLAEDDPGEGWYTLTWGAHTGDWAHEDVITTFTRRDNIGVEVVLSIDVDDFLSVMKGQVLCDD